MNEHRTNRSRSLRMAAIAVITAMATAALAAGAPQAVGIASAVLNDVSIESAGTRQFRRAVLRQRVALADQVQTGQRSQLQVLLLDRSVFTVGANARLTINRYVYEPASGRSFSASVAKGAFRFMSGRPDRGGNSSINTPVASIGIRGTIVDGVVGAEAIAIANGERGIGQNRDSDPLTATLLVLRGPGQWTQGKAIPGEIAVTAGGKSVTLDRPMLAAYVPRSGAAPIGPFTISMSGLARLQALIFPSVAEWLAATEPVSNTAYPIAPPRQVRRRPPRGGFPPEDAGGGPQVPAYGAGIPTLPQFPGGMAPSSGQSTPPRQQASTNVAQQPASAPATTQVTATPSSQPQSAAAQPQSAAGSQSLAPVPQATPAAGNPSPPPPPAQQSPGVTPNGQSSVAGRPAAAQLQSPQPSLKQAPQSTLKQAPPSPPSVDQPAPARVPGKP